MIMYNKLREASVVLSKKNCSLYLFKHSFDDCLEYHILLHCYVLINILSLKATT